MDSVSWGTTVVRNGGRGSLRQTRIYGIELNKHSSTTRLTHCTQRLIPLATLWLTIPSTKLRSRHCSSSKLHNHAHLPLLASPRHPTLCRNAACRWALSARRSGLAGSVLGTSASSKRDHENLSSLWPDILFLISIVRTATFLCCYDRSDTRE